MDSPTFQRQPMGTSTIIEFQNEDVIQQLDLVTEELGSTVCIWSAKSKVSISADIHRFDLLVTCEDGDQDSIKLGTLRIDSAEILGLGQHSDSFSRRFVKADNEAPALELASVLTAVRQVPLGTEENLANPDPTTNNPKLIRSGLSGPDPSYLKKLGDIFVKQYERSQDVDDLNSAICIYEVMVELSAGNNSNKSAYLYDVGTVALRRFNCLGEFADIQKAISFLTQAVQLDLDDHPDKPLHLNQLGNAFLGRFEISKQRTDIDQSVSMKEDAVRLAVDANSNKLDYLHDLGNLFVRRFELFGNKCDMDKSILVLEEAVVLAHDGHPSRPAYLKDLGSSFSTRFRYFGELDDLTKSLSFKEEALRLISDDHPDKPAYLNNLGNAFAHRFERFGQLSDIDKSISMFEYAVRLTPDDDPDMPIQLANLGSSIGYRFLRLGNLADISKSIALIEKAVQLTPNGHSKKAALLSKLGIAYSRRFERLGDVSDIDNSILMKEEAVRLVPDGHPSKPALLNNVSNSLLIRFELLGELADVNKSIAIGEEAIHLISDSHRDKPGLLSNLGNSFLRRYERLSELADIDKSVSTLETAVGLTPDGHSYKPGFLSNLGNSLLRRFECSKQLVDLNMTISVFDEAVRLTSEDHPDKPARLSNLGRSLQTRFEHTGEAQDIEKSICMHEAAVKLTPDGHLHRASRLLHLGESLLIHFERLGDNSALDRAIAVSSVAAASSSGPFTTRFSAAMLWVQCARLARDPSLLEAYGSTLILLPKLAWLGLPMGDRHRELTNAGNIVNDAAATAIESGKYGTAVEWLEQGRSIVWDQLLQLRTPLDDLQDLQPQLANQLLRVSKELEQASARGGSNQPLSLEQAAQQHRKLTLEWETLVETIRNVKGFDRFLLPKTLSELIPGAACGPVVVLNTSEIRCDALILRPESDDVLHVPLPRFTYNDAKRLCDVLAITIRKGHRSDIPSTPDRAGRVWARPLNQELKLLLSELWLNVTKPVLEALCLQSPPTNNLLHIWWCPTGPLVFLPIHASGIHSTSVPGSKLTDFAISSYTTRIGALINARKTPVPRFSKLLTVAQPSAPGQPSLPGTLEELNRIQERAKGLLTVLLNETEATTDAVLKGMKECSWVHLSCHGVQNNLRPTDSALLLYDGRLRLSEIIKLSLPNANFAFLSACHTAKGAIDLPEEAVHLAGGMLLAGYRAVIATMWQIRDMDAPGVADDIYAHLFKDHPPDHTQAAHALHSAILRLRARVGEENFLSWVPFIHIGA